MPDTSPAPARRMPRAVREFLDTEIAGGIALVVATAVALAWANSPWRASYRSLWSTELAVRLGGHGVALVLHDWVNEGLMALFFLVVGLELKRELVHGELRDRRRAALPALAALGGMAVPAALYAALNGGGAGQRGWGVPMATDIAFALGVLALLGRRVPPSLRLFLLTLAIVDDVGSVVVITVFYTARVAWEPLALAAGLVAAAAGLRALRVTWTPAYVTAGAAAWLALHEAGVPAGLVGFALGLLAPASTAAARRVVTRSRAEPGAHLTPGEARATARLVRESVPVVEWLEHVLHPWSSFAVVPLFALANAGVPLGAHELSHAVHSPVTLGVVVARVLGKPVGITLAAWLAVRSGLGRLPAGVGWRHVAGIGTLAAIGFTVALFIADVGLTNAVLRDEARVGVLAAALLGSLLGAAVLARGRPSARRGGRGRGAEDRMGP